MISMALTKRQKEVLDFIAKFVDENGYSPSYEEIAHGLKLASLATVHKHISALDAKKCHFWAKLRPVNRLKPLRTGRRSVLRISPATATHTRWKSVATP